MNDGVEEICRGRLPDWSLLPRASPPNAVGFRRPQLAELLGPLRLLRGELPLQIGKRLRQLTGPASLCLEFGQERGPLALGLRDPFIKQTSQLLMFEFAVGSLRGPLCRGAAQISPLVLNRYPLRLEFVAVCFEFVEQQAEKLLDALLPQPQGHQPVVDRVERRTGVQGFSNGRSREHPVRARRASRYRGAICRRLAPRYKRSNDLARGIKDENGSPGNRNSMSRFPVRQIGLQKKDRSAPLCGMPRICNACS